MEYLISINSLLKSEMHLLKYIGRIVCVEALRGMIRKSSRCHMIPEPASISFLWSFSSLHCSPDNVGLKIHVRNVRNWFDICGKVVHGRNLVRGSAYWLTY